MRCLQLWRCAGVLLLSPLLTASGMADDADWHHARSAHGVEVETRAVAGSAFQEFRARTVVPAPLEQVVGWWRDPSTFTSWVNSCMEARAVDAGKDVRATYLRFDFPFPASDRDVVLRAVEIEAGPERVIVESHHVAGAVPEIEGLVRMPAMRGRWQFTAHPGGTEVIYRQHMDAGGDLPAFIVNRATVDNPIGTLAGLAAYARDHAR